MRSRNITAAEREHMGRVKQVACGCCDGPGGFAHHIVQGSHWITVGLCFACHQGDQGIHGDKTLWRIYKRDEWSALNLTLQRVDKLRRDGMYD